MNNAHPHKQVIYFLSWVWLLLPLSMEDKNLWWYPCISIIYLKKFSWLSHFDHFATFCLPNTSVMIGSWNTELLHYSFSLVCVPEWPWALVSQVAVISFCKPSMNDYGKSCLQQFLFPLALFPPTCLYFSLLLLWGFFPDFQFPLLPYTLQPKRLS